MIENKAKLWKESSNISESDLAGFKTDVQLEGERFELLFFFFFFFFFFCLILI
jgi:hypothetical protein